MADSKKWPPTLRDHLHAACSPVPGYTDAIRAISRVGLHKTPDGHALGTLEAIVILFESEMTITQDKGILKKRVDSQRVTYADIPAVIEDNKELSDKTGEFAIQFLGAGNTPLFRLAWQWWRGMLSAGTNERLASAAERDRVLSCLEAARYGGLLPDAAQIEETPTTKPIATRAIWDDPDVQQIYIWQDGRPFLRHDLLDGGDGLLAELWISKDSVLDNDKPVNLLRDACLAGISAIERFSAEVPAGWQKLLVYRVGQVSRGLWDYHHDKRAAPYADWTVATIEDNRWGPDGGSTALGQQHSACMATAALAGGGIQWNATTEEFASSTGESARQQAAEWYMAWFNSQFDD